MAPTDDFLSPFLVNLFTFLYLDFVVHNRLGSPDLVNCLCLLLLLFFSCKFLSFLSHDYLCKLLWPVTLHGSRCVEATLAGARFPRLTIVSQKPKVLIIFVSSSHPGAASPWMSLTPILRYKATTISSSQSFFLMAEKLRSMLLDTLSIRVGVKRETIHEFYVWPWW